MRRARSSRRSASTTVRSRQLPRACASRSTPPTRSQSSSGFCWVLSKKPMRIDFRGSTPVGRSLRRSRPSTTARMAAASASEQAQRERRRSPRRRRAPATVAAPVTSLPSMRRRSSSPPRRSRPGRAGSLAEQRLHEPLEVLRHVAHARDERESATPVMWASSVVGRLAKPVRDTRRSASRTAGRRARRGRRPA